VVVGLIVTQRQTATQPDRPNRPRHVEAELQLNKLAKQAKVYFITQAHFPIGHVGRTPTTPCCDVPDQRCREGYAVWNDPVWKELDFQIDEPARYQYDYESRDGQTLEAHAIGTSDCSEAPKIYTLRGTVQNGNAMMEIIEPPP
jgi:hypothetical protein